MVLCGNGTEVLSSRLKQARNKIMRWETHPVYGQEGPSAADLLADKRAIQEHASLSRIA
jgi:hypothetical protein